MKANIHDFLCFCCDCYSLRLIKKEVVKCLRNINHVYLKNLVNKKIMMNIVSILCLAC